MICKEDLIQLIDERIESKAEIVSISYDIGDPHIRLLCVDENGCVYEVLIKT